MEAIILAGGYGTRLKSIITDVPKPMAPIKGEPFLTYLLNQLNNQGFTKVVLAVGFMHDKIINFYGHQFKNLQLDYSIEDIPLGTGGCVKKAMNLTNDEFVYIINGDTFFDIDFKKIKIQSNILIVCKYMVDTSRYGKVKIENHKILGFEEKGKGGLGYINGGIYLMKRNVFNDYALPEKFSMEKDFFERFVDSLKIEAHLSDDYFIDIGVPEDYERAQYELKK